MSRDSSKNESLPSYAELKARSDAPAGSAWGLFGTDDQIGTVNLLTEDAAVQAAALVRRGASFGLDYDLNAFTPPVSPYRKTLVHCEVCRLDGQVHDDYVNDFFPQAGSHIDGLRHHKHSVEGFYNNVDEYLVGSGTPDLGVQHIGRRGMVGRGVLVDVARYRQAVGRPIDLMQGDPITLDDVKGAVKSQGITLRTADLLLLHTGWAAHFVALDIKTQQHLIGERTFCGLAQSEEMLAWLWDNHFSVVASDTVAVEVMPTVATSPFDRNVRGMMHPDLIALLGICLGEMWKLDELAKDCATDEVYECMVVSKPITLVGGVGSPCNAVAIK